MEGDQSEKYVELKKSHMEDEAYPGITG